MGTELGDVSAMVFRRVVREDVGTISLDSRVLGFLIGLDGKTNAGQIAGKSGVSDEALRRVIPRLVELGLVEPVETGVPLLSRGFFRYLNAELSIAVGPLAQILIEDAVEDMGLTFHGFPRNRAAELTDYLARQIPREEKRMEFQQAMLMRIRAGKL